MSDYTVIEYQPKNVPTAVAQLTKAGLLDKAVSEVPGWDVPSVIDVLLMGTFKLWVVYDGDLNPQGLMITELVKYPTEDVISVFALAGNGTTKEWMREAEATLEEHAKELGVSTIEAWARPGVARALNRFFGYTDFRHLVRKSL